MNDIKIYLDEINEDTYKENYWEECCLSSSTPITLYKKKYPIGGLPMGTQWDGYDEETNDNISSYAEFENAAISSDDNERIKKLENNKKVFIKNNIYTDLSTNGKISSIDRIELNSEDGYLQHSVLSGNKVKINELSNAEWYNQKNENVQKDIYNSPIFIAPKVWATQVQDLGFSKNDDNTDEYFFDNREDFVSAFPDDEFSEKEAMQIDTRNNPELIGFKPKLNSIMSFNDIIAYCRCTGFPFSSISSMISSLIYFSHEVINILIPKQIVLIMYSYTGQIDIPIKDYIPNIVDPVKNFPDYNNRIYHIINMMKMITNRLLFDKNLGHFYLKITITPALIIINYINGAAQNARLILEIPTIDNQILYDCEIRNNVSPVRFIQNYNGFWNNNLDNSNDFEVLQRIRSTYECKLNAIDQSELDEYLKFTTNGFTFPQNNQKNTYNNDIPF